MWQLEPACTCSGLEEFMCLYYLGLEKVVSLGEKHGLGAVAEILMIKDEAWEAGEGDVFERCLG